MRRNITIFLVAVAMLVSVQKAEAQQAAVKTNLLYGIGTLTPNLGVEIGLGKRTTLDLWGVYSPWNLKGSQSDNKKLVHWMIQPEFRYWLCRKFNGHFFGVHALYSNYNIGGRKIPPLFEKVYRYEGYAIGGGASYGYHLILGKRWGAEFNIGMGAARLNYDKYDCPKCGNRIGKINKTYFGPTKAGITLVYLIK